MPITAYPDVCHRGEVRNGSGGRASNARCPPERPRSPLSYRGGQTMPLHVRRSQSHDHESKEFHTCSTTSAGPRPGCSSYIPFANAPSALVSGEAKNFREAVSGREAAHRRFMRTHRVCMKEPPRLGCRGGSSVPS